jgi:hypothetical protein
VAPAPAGPPGSQAFFGQLRELKGEAQTAADAAKQAAHAAQAAAEDARAVLEEGADTAARVMTEAAQALAAAAERLGAEPAGGTVPAVAGVDDKTLARVTYMAAKKALETTHVRVSAPPLPWTWPAILAGAAAGGGVVGGVAAVLVMRFF